LIDGGADGRYLPTGHLVYALSGILLAVPFDAARLEVSGGPVPVVEGVRRASADSGGTGTAQFSYSKTGSLAFLPGPAKLVAGAFELALFDRKGGAEPLKVPPGSYVSPRVSPDGKSIAVDTEDDTQAIVWVYDLSGASAMRRLTFGGKNRAPVWSPDGQWIAFQSDREGELAIFRQRADGSGTAERLTRPEAGSSHTPESWSLDGAHLLFSVQKDQQFTLWTLSVNDRRVAPFGNVRSTIHFDAAFSPDGRWVAYQSRESALRGEAPGTFLQPFPSAATKYLVPQAGGNPYWIAKSGELILNSAATRSFAVTVKTTPQVVFGRPTDFSRVGRTENNPVTSRRAVDAMPDGEHVIGVRTAGASDYGEDSQILVVLNWFDELKARVPAR
jgi:dipeptidyl aminopeptidase/acylaminoacyl peptidase